MTDIFVKAKLKDGHKAELAAQLSGGILAKGNRYEDNLQEALLTGWAIDNAEDAYFTFPEATEDRLPEDARRVITRYFDIEREIPRDQVPEAELTRVEGFTPMPEWLGIDVDNWRNE